jgi:protein-tyrosine-phosphatase
MDIERRARIHRALGDEVRLRVVDALMLADRTPAELGELVGLPSNLVAHHLRVLEESGLLLGHRGEGDRRKRYLSLDKALLERSVLRTPLRARSVLFVCTHNSARSQFAEAALKKRIDLDVQSAGTIPADRIHPKAISTAAGMGIELASGRPKPYDEVRGAPDLVISVCDRAREAPMPFMARRLHWSVPDPVEIDRVDAFRTAFGTINDRVDRLVEAMEGGITS